MSEVALEGRKGFYASFQYVTLIGGQLLALLVVVILQHLLSDVELRAWGWRIPFALGAALAVVALFLRRSLNETSNSETRARKDAGSLRGLWHNRKAFIMVLGFTAGGSLSFYTYTTYMQKYLVNTAGMNAKSASGLMTLALFVFMLLQPLFGALSDKIGRRSSMLFFWGAISIVDGTDSVYFAGGDQPGYRLLSGYAGVGDSELLHLYQWYFKGGNVSSGGQGAGCRVILRRSECLIWRFC
ncbi:hypothetical protein DaDZ19_35330 [Dickeya ananatis]